MNSVFDVFDAPTQWGCKTLGCNNWVTSREHDFCEACVTKILPSGEVSPLPERKHKHYHKDVTHLSHIDIYRILSLYDVRDPCLQHAIKKLLVAGGRGTKDSDKDIQEAIDSLLRWQEMRVEDTV